MYYVCIENNQIVSILNYEPNVPVTVQVIAISAEQYVQIQSQTHYFDVMLLSVHPMPDHVLQIKANQEHNRTCLKYLMDTDWKVLRHIRQLHLGEPTSLSADEYTQLENERARMADQIKI
jgi:hypothetical protein